MGIDLLSKNQVTRWALKSNHLEKDSTVLQKHNPQMGEIQQGTRNTADGSFLQWKLTLPLSAPEVEIVPFVLNWNFSKKHPSELLPNMGCTLIELFATHPNPELFETVFRELDCNFRIKKSASISIQLKLKTPNGIVEI